MGSGGQNLQQICDMLLQHATVSIFKFRTESLVWYSRLTAAYLHWRSVSSPQTFALLEALRWDHTHDMPLGRPLPHSYHEACQPLKVADEWR
jgi:hypothetical protein